MGEIARAKRSAPPGARLALREDVPEHVAGAILTVDLGGIRANYRLLKSKLGAAACACALKADGYGLGAAEIANALLAEGCTVFFVAQLCEALGLRQALGPEPVIYVLNGLTPGSEHDAADAGVAPVLNSIEQIAAWAERAKKSKRRLPAALQIDTGMSRFGLAPSEVETLAASPFLLDGIRLDLVMSHLACADEPDNVANRLQRESFDRLRQALPSAPASLANSSAIFLGRDYHYDLARPGAALYGVNPTPGRPNPMRQVARLQAKIVQTREIGDGVGIGYGHASRARAAMRLATISLGYADGWPRRAVGAAFHNGTPLPFAGRVSMDSIVLDISALAPGTLKAGDLVDLIGPDQTVDRLAEQAGTIGYEILTGFGARFHRRYLGG
jgi:alanine racemase